jgi:plasmid stabilization system protein ParE
VPRLRFTASAKSDLDAIAIYVAEQSGSRMVAERFTNELRQKCAELAAATILMGRPRSDLRPDLRSHPHKSYVIFFRYVGDVFEVVNIIEGHRDIPAMFRDDLR